MKLKIVGCLAVALIATGTVVVVVRGLKKLNGILESMIYTRDDLGEGI